jgi:hypothetical protein
MIIKTEKYVWLTVLIFSLAIFGCAHTKGELQSELDQKEQEIKELRAENNRMDRQLTETQKRLDSQIMATQAAEQRAMETQRRAQAVSTEIPLLPPDAMLGQCFARVFVPPAYRTVTEDVLTQAASERIEVIPAKYEMVDQKVMIKEASSKIETIPAKYDWADEKVMVREAHSTWKKGRGLIEKVDNTTGEIMCLVEVPAEYKTVKKRVMVQPQTSRVINIPAEYQTVKVRKLVSPAREEVVKVPAKYETIERTEQVADGRMEWRKVLCETNMTRENIMKIQTALKNAGHDPGPIDGIVGRLTRTAVNSYQKEKGLETGALTYSTIESLNVDLSK